MARVTRNSLLRGISGKLGGLVFRQVGDQTIVSAAAAKENRKPRSPKQQAQLDKFAAATRYARAQMQDPAAAALYATGIDERHAGAYNVAVADYLHAPVITAVDCPAYPGQPDQPIRVWATDNFGVTAVTIRMLTSEGVALETGAAIQQPDGYWQYLPRQASAVVPGTTLQVHAIDRPGNVAEVTHLLK